MSTERPYSRALQRVTRSGLRPTRQRLGLARLLFDAGDRHITAEMLHGEALASGLKVSLATVYNTLHQFRHAGLLREVVVEAGRSYFDTNTEDHHHFFDVDSGELTDIPLHDVPIPTPPAAPEGMEVERVDVIIRVRGSRA